MIRQVLRHPDDRLATLCAPVLAVDGALRGLVADMFETMYDAYGRGLAAPQVAELSRLFVMDATWKAGEPTPLAFINPEVLWASPEQQVNEEGCLSIPDTPRRVARPKRVEMMWLDTDGAQQRGAFEGFEAACICHEIDHLDGVLILDHEVAA